MGSTCTCTVRDGGAYFEVGGAENERQRRELVGGSGGILPQKVLKSRVSEIVFTAFSARYFLKKLAWIKRKMKGTFSAYSNILEVISQPSGLLR